MSDTELVKIFDEIVRWRSPATMNTQTKGNGKQQFIAFLGYKANGDAVRKSLGVDKDRAYGELAKINQLIAERQFKDAPNVFEVAIALEVRAAQKKLEGFGVSLMQAVDFFLIHHRPASGHLTVEEAGAKFVEDLKRNGTSEAYYNQYEKVYLPHFYEVAGKKRLIDVTQDDAENFIFKTKASVNATTKGEYIQKLRTFFNRMAELDYYHKDLNPFTKVKKPQLSRKDPSLTEKDRVLPVSECYFLFAYLSESKQWDLIVYLALQLFCGVRAQEALRLNWEEIDPGKKAVNISARIAKKRRRRLIEDIPDNACNWLDLCKRKMNGEWTTRTESGFKQKLKRVKKHLRIKHADKKHLKFEFHTNFARVSFASYGFALFGKDKTISMMGHTSNQDLLYTNYRELVSKDMAKEYFDIDTDELETAEVRTVTKETVSEITNEERKKRKELRKSLGWKEQPLE